MSISQKYVSLKLKVAQSCPTLCDPMVCSLQGSSVHGIFQARVLEWGAIVFSTILKLKKIAEEGSLPKSFYKATITCRSVGSADLTWLWVALPWEKAVAPHSSTLAWQIPWTEEPGRLQSMGSLQVGYD